MFSALPLIADIGQCSRHVRFVPCTHSRVVMRRCLGIDHGPPVTYQYVILGSKSVLLSAFSRASVPSSSIPIRRQEPATSAARIAASRRSTCLPLKVAPMLGEMEWLYSTIVGRCPAIPQVRVGSSADFNVRPSRKSPAASVRSASCQRRTCSQPTRQRFVNRPSLPLIDDLVRRHQQCLRHDQPQHLRGLKVDDEIYIV